MNLFNAIQNTDIVSVAPSKLIGYPSNASVFLSGAGTWITPSSATIPDNTISIAKLLAVPANSNMCFVHSATTGIPTAALLVDANISATANINAS